MTIGEKVSITGTFIEEKYAKNDWRVCLFKSVVTNANFPCQEAHVTEGSVRTYTAKGNVAPAFVGETLSLTGEWTFSKKDKEYTFIIKYGVPTLPVTHEDAEIFICSVKGIGQKMAMAIMSWCGGDLRKIYESPRKMVAEIKGLSERKGKVLADKIQEVSVMDEISKMVGGLSDPKTARKLVAVYGRDAYTIISATPYKTAKVIGFEDADNIAMHQPGATANNPERIEAAIVAALRAIKTKNCAIMAAKPVLHNKIMELLQLHTSTRNPVTSDEIVAVIQKLKRDKVLAGVTLNGNGFFYLYEDREMEKSLAEKIYQLGSQVASNKESARFSNAFDVWARKHEGIKLHARQSDAVYGAANLFSVVTGGPGTGKTTVLKAIMETYEIMFPDSPITLMAPTGLAAKRMTESCERNAKTIHKALGLTPAESTSGFTAANDKNVPGGLIIVDEFSMVGIHLAHFLLSAIEIRPDTRIVFVGDVDQLAPVTPGTVLADLIRCDRVHVTRLTKNFRQAGGSRIADIAVRFNTGKINGLNFGGDCIFTEADGDETIADMVVDEFLESVRQYGLEQTFAITPTRRSTEDKLSSNSLNRKLQAVLNGDPSVPSVTVGMWTFRVGDRVINKKNAEDVINGDIGVVKELIPEDVGVTLKIDFAGTLAVFGPERLKNLELAYAITVHSSQGCEFKSVITPISPSHKMMLSRNLVYTAITRAKLKMHLIGNKNSFLESCNTAQSKNKSDILFERLVMHQKK